MPAFKDANGREWQIRLDGLLIKDLRESLKIDLADVTGETYLTLSVDQASLTAAVCFLCAEQLKAAGINDRQLAGALSGELADGAWEALWGAAKVFFRPKLWSALESAFNQRTEMREQWAAVQPALALLNQPNLPEPIREAIADGLARKMMGEATDSQSLTESRSVTGPAVNLSPPASISPDCAESTPAA